ncbi:MAG: hypothetical protein M3Q23_05920 [Actinomycetota bacterium]|nr:hypothetical protein [Actinomycetota bacterium]
MPEPNGLFPHTVPDGVYQHPESSLARTWSELGVSRIPAPDHSGPMDVPKSLLYTVAGARLKSLL